MHLEPQLPDCYGNINQLEQVFLNFITNARDTLIEADEIKGRADPEYMGKLTIITRLSKEQDNSIEILFKDNGMGIDHEHEDKIFDPFFTTKEVGKGTGLGLSISYGIINEHNGSIDIRETSDCGTTFIITLRKYAAS